MILPRVSAQSTWWMDTTECGGCDGTVKIVWCSNWKEKCPRLVLDCAGTKRQSLEFASLR